MDTITTTEKILAALRKGEMWDYHDVADQVRDDLDLTGARDITDAARTEADRLADEIWETITGRPDTWMFRGTRVAMRAEEVADA